MVTVREYITAKKPCQEKKLKDMTKEMLEATEVPDKLKGTKKLMEEKSGVEY